MSSSDSFIDEVAEAVRKDRLVHYARRYGWIPALAVIGIVVGVGVWEWRKSQDAATAQAFGDALLEALASETAEGRAVSVQAIPVEGDQAAIRDLTAAGDLAQVDFDEAASLLRGVIDDADANQIYRDVARLKLVQMPNNRLTSDQRLEIIEPLVGSESAFRLSALELRGLTYIEQNQTDLAVADLKLLMNDAEASSAQRQRALQMLIALGADPELP